MPIPLHPHTSATISAGDHFLERINNARADLAETVLAVATPDEDGEIVFNAAGMVTSASFDPTLTDTYPPEQLGYILTDMCEHAYTLACEHVGTVLYTARQ